MQHEALDLLRVRICCARRRRARVGVALQLAPCSASASARPCSAPRRLEARLGREGGPVADLRGERHLRRSRRRVHDLLDGLRRRGGPRRHRRPSHTRRRAHELRDDEPLALPVPQRLEPGDAAAARPPRRNARAPALSPPGGLTPDGLGASRGSSGRRRRDGARRRRCSEPPCAEAGSHWSCARGSHNVREAQARVVAPVAPDPRPVSAAFTLRWTGRLLQRYDVPFD